MLQRGAQIRQRGKLCVIADVRLVDGRVEKAEAIQGAQLVVGVAGGGISQVAIELAGIDAEDVIGDGRVASQAIRRAGIIPCLGADAGGVGDEDVFVQTAGEQIGVAVVRAPFVSHAINRAVDVAHEQPCFQTAQGDVGVGFVDDEIKIFDEDRSGRKRPGVGGQKRDLFVGRDESAVVRHGQITAFHRRIRPQWRVGSVRNESAGRSAIGVCRQTRRFPKATAAACRGKWPG